MSFNRSFQSLIFAAALCHFWLGALAPQATAVSLASLVAGGSLNVGNSRFTDWQLLGLDDTSAPLTDLTLIDVTTLTDSLPQNPGIRFAADGQLGVVGINSIDLHVHYRVEALGGTNSFEGQTLALSGATFNGPGGIMFVTGELAGSGGNLNSTVAIADNVTPYFQFSDTTSFARKSQVDVALNVFLTGVNGSDDLSLDAFSQRFVQTGLPGLLGDYNDDGSVNAADYTVYRNRKAGVGGTTLVNEFATQGLVTVDDYNYWKSRYGLVAGAGSAVAGEEVPEAATGTLLLAALVVVAGRRRFSLSRCV